MSIGPTCEACGRAATYGHKCPGSQRMKKMQDMRKRMESVLAQEILSLRTDNTRLNAECHEHLQARARLAKHLNSIFQATINQTDPNAVRVTDPNRAEDDYTLAALTEIIKLHTENERLRALHTDEKPLVRLLVTSETILMLPNDTTTTGANLVKVMTDLDAEIRGVREAQLEVADCLLVLTSTAEWGAEDAGDLPVVDAIPDTLAAMKADDDAIHQLYDAAFDEAADALLLTADDERATLDAMLCKKIAEEIVMKRDLAAAIARAEAAECVLADADGHEQRLRDERNTERAARETAERELARIKTLVGYPDSPLPIDSWTTVAAYDALDEDCARLRHEGAEARNAMAAETNRANAAQRDLAAARDLLREEMALLAIRGAVKPEWNARVAALLGRSIDAKGGT